jgi:hypothetical protein
MKNTATSLLALLAACSIFNTVAASDKPNVLLILADDLGWSDTTLYGTTRFYQTPNIERSAARGMLSPVPTRQPCSPTRASILSGQTPPAPESLLPRHVQQVLMKPVAVSGLPQARP